MITNPQAKLLRLLSKQETGFVKTPVSCSPYLRVTGSQLRSADVLTRNGYLNVVVVGGCLTYFMLSSKGRAEVIGTGAEATAFEAGLEAAMVKRVLFDSKAYGIDPATHVLARVTKGGL